MQFRQLFGKNFNSVTGQLTGRVTYRVECMPVKCLIISHVQTISHSVGQSVDYSRC